MRTITIELRPIKEAPKDGTVIFSWWNKRPVYIAWRENMVAKWEPQEQKWYLPYRPDKRTEVDEGEWVFVRFNTVNGQWNNDAPCGLFKPEEFADLPCLWNVKETKDESNS